MDRFLFILQHTHGVIQIQTFHVRLYLLHGKSQLKQIPYDIEAADVLQTVQPIAVLSSLGFQYADFLIVTKRIHTDPV